LGNQYFGDSGRKEFQGNGVAKSNFLSLGLAVETLARKLLFWRLRKEGKLINVIIFF
jgi:hypothetical protein